MFKGMSLNDERIKALTGSLGQSFNSKIIVKNPIGERVVIPNHPYLILHSDINYLRRHTWQVYITLAYSV